MTGIVAAADLHVGAGSDHRVDALADQEHVLNQLAECAIARDLDLVLLAGDVFHRPKPTPAELHVFDRFARQLADAGIPTVAILGNAGHDQLGTDLPSALELFASPWLRVSRVPEVIRCVGDVAVCTLPSVPISRLVAMRGGGERAETVEIATMLLLEAAAELRSQVPAGWPSILMGHWSVSGASLPNGLPVSTLTEPVLPVDELERLGFDAIVMGHIHRGQLYGQGTTLYTGSPMVHDFGEAGFEHGVWILDFPGGSSSNGATSNGDGPSEEHRLHQVGDAGSTPASRFIPLVDRRFVTVNVDLAKGVSEPGSLRKSEASSPVPDGIVEGAATGPGSLTSLDETDLVNAAIAEQMPLHDAVIRVTYRATEEQHRRVDHGAVQALLDDAGVHKVYGGIHWDPVREDRARAAGVDEQLDPISAVTAWCGANDIAEQPALALEHLTLEYLEAAA